MIEELEKLFSDLKEKFTEYTEKKSYKTRGDVRKILQGIKTKTQEMRIWMLKDFK